MVLDAKTGKKAKKKRKLRVTRDRHLPRLVPLAELLQIPDLEAEPWGPTVIVDFDFGATGRNRGAYHWLYASDDDTLLFLVFDMRYQGGVGCYVPPSQDPSHGLRLRVTSPTAPEVYEYACFGVTSTFDFGIFRFIQLVQIAKIGGSLEDVFNRNPGVLEHGKAGFDPGGGYAPGPERGEPAYPQLESTVWDIQSDPSQGRQFGAGQLFR